MEDSERLVRRRVNGWLGSMRRANGRFGEAGEAEGKWLAWIHVEGKRKIQGDW